MNDGLAKKLQVNQSIKDTIHPAYFETHFEQLSAFDEWPKNFAIVTAYATTGEVWTDAENKLAGQLLETNLANQQVWIHRLTGYSPKSGHAEPGWAAEISFESAVDLGKRFRQDAIYYVSQDTLFVILCRHPHLPVFVDSFRKRLRIRGPV